MSDGNLSNTPDQDDNLPDQIQQEKQPSLADANLPSGEQQHSSRQMAAKVLLAAFVVLFAVSILAVWSRNQIFESDRFVRTVAPLSSNPDIQVAVSEKVADEIIAEIDKQTQGDPAFEGVSGVALRQGIHFVATTATQRIIESDQFSEIWEQLARTSHKALVISLKGGDRNLLLTDKGQVAIDLTPVLEKVNDELKAQGIDVFSGERLKEIDLTFAIFSAEGLDQLQSVTRTIDKLANVLPWLTLAALIGYLALSLDRWRAGIHASFGIGLTMVVLLLLFIVARWWYLRELDPAIDQDAARAFFDTLTRYLRRAIRLLALAGFVIAAILALLRPRPGESGVRERLETGNRSLVTRWPSVGSAEAYVAAHRSTAIGIFLGGIGILAILWDQISVTNVVLLTVITVIGFVVLSRVRSPQPIETSS